MIKFLRPTPGLSKYSKICRAVTIMLISTLVFYWKSDISMLICHLSWSCTKQHGFPPWQQLTMMYEQLSPHQASILTHIRRGLREQRNGGIQLPGVIVQNASGGWRKNETKLTDLTDLTNPTNLVSQAKPVQLTALTSCNMSRCTWPSWPTCGVTFTFARCRLLRRRLRRMRVRDKDLRR